MSDRNPGSEHSLNSAWTIASGCVTLMLSVIAFFLPDIELLPKAGLVGWLLVIAGIVELFFGWMRGPDIIGKAALGSGLITALAGLLFIGNPTLRYLPVAFVVLAWLLIRGSWVFAMALRARRDHLGPWLLISGAADVSLGFALIFGLQFSALVITLFGPTPEVIAQFAIILAASFFFTGMAQLAIAIGRPARKPLVINGA